MEGVARCRSSNSGELTWSYDGKTYRRKPGKIHDYGTGAHGTLSLQDGMPRALEVSCNVFFATLATKVGPERLARAIQRAEFGRPPDVANVAAYLPETGFGQVTVKVSPIEMATLAAAVGMAGSETAAYHHARLARCSLADLL